MSAPADIAALAREAISPAVGAATTVQMRDNAVPPAPNARRRNSIFRTLRAAHHARALPRGPLLWSPGRAVEGRGTRMFAQRIK